MRIFGTLGLPNLTILTTKMIMNNSVHLKFHLSSCEWEIIRNYIYYTILYTTMLYYMIPYYTVLVLFNVPYTVHHDTRHNTSCHTLSCMSHILWHYISQL